MRGFAGRLEKAVKAKGKNKLVDDDKVPDFHRLIDAISAADKADVQYDRGGSWPVHVSTAIADDFCGRRIMLMDKLKRQFPKRTTSSDFVLWAIGKATEAHNRKRIIESYGTKNVYGRWTCNCEDSVSYGFGKNISHIICTRCKTSVTSNYHEATLLVDNLLTGNPDILVLMAPDSKLTVCEMKSIKPEEFKTISKPKINHVMQAYFYLRMLEHSSDILFAPINIEVNTEVIRILYTNKGYSFDYKVESAHKEFEVKVSEMSTAVKKIYDDKIKELKILKSRGKVPKRTLCDTQHCSMAKACHVQFDCFSYGD